MIEQILRQRYKIIEKLGSGGVGETYIAEDLDIPVSPKPKCVVKRLHPKAIDADNQRLFQKEAEMLYKLGENHDQIPKLFAYFEENGEFFLVQELIEGHNLTEELIPGKPWSEAEVTQLLQEILEILAFVHQHNVIHRDIKPSNIMRRKADGKLVLIDFGAVKEVSNLKTNSNDSTTLTIGIGTFGYMPSEQALGKPKLSSDIYAVGMMAIQALTGISPKQLPEDENGELIWQNHAHISDELTNIINLMVRYHFNQRYQSAIEVLQDLKPDTVHECPQSSISTLTPVKVEDKWGYKDQNGQLVITPQFEKAGKFSEGLAEVKIGSKWGYIDQSGRVLIKPEFDKVWSFSEGQARVKFGDKSTYIDKTGKILFDEASSFFEGLARVKIGERYGYIDKTIQVVIPAQFDKAWNFSEGLAVVKIGDRYGYIDKTGELVNQPRFEQAWSFSEGMALVRISDKYGYIDKAGELVSQLFEEVGSFSEGLATVKINEKWGYINKTGQLVIQPHFSVASNFCQGKASVELKNKLLGLLPMGEQVGYIDKTGKFI
ncbi:WG repeat-containing protein [Limnofasciculus baicalensis]|uniref:WG repeat-containing protein n=1 Tax=Limnofasciculus baicalensis BBK-W-15 TaxID=2699891 RepID=A0AAE3GQX7_9CYAN|nr:WG repeat-containing protein [Limnofasciculus baicalensis]MCP2728899.1 WG repeat-containing protein [Limnofasciculus baicalensis BBK-W-15]